MEIIISLYLLLPINYYVRTYEGGISIFFFQALKHNGSLYAHIFFARSGYTPDPNDPEYQPLAAFVKTHCMNVFLGIFIYLFFKIILFMSVIK